MQKTIFFHPRKYNASILGLLDTRYILTVDKNSKRWQTSTLRLQRASVVQQLQQAEQREEKESLDDKACPKAMSFFDFEDDILEERTEEILDDGCQLQCDNTTSPNPWSSKAQQE